MEGAHLLVVAGPCYQEPSTTLDRSRSRSIVVPWWQRGGSIVDRTALRVLGGGRCTMNWQQCSTVTVGMHGYLVVSGERPGSATTRNEAESRCQRARRRQAGDWATAAQRWCRHRCWCRPVTSCPCRLSSGRATQRTTTQGRFTLQTATRGAATASPRDRWHRPSGGDVRELRSSSDACYRQGLAQATETGGQSANRRADGRRRAVTKASTGYG